MEKELENIHLPAELWALEYSPSQRCFHTDELERSIATNMKCFKEGYSSDWILLWVGTSTEIDRVADHLRPRLENLRRLDWETDPSQIS